MKSVVAKWTSCIAWSLFLIGGASAPVRAACPDANPVQIQGCSFYSACLEEKLSCGDKGYPLNYGKKYCERFSAVNLGEGEGQLSANGIHWRDQTLACLQRRLIDNLDNINSCDQAKSIGFGTHAECYTYEDHSICELPVNDWKTIFGVVSYVDIAQKPGLSQIKEVVSDCEYRLENHKMELLWKWLKLTWKYIDENNEPVIPEDHEDFETLREINHKLYLIQNLKAANAERSI